MSRVSRRLSRTESDEAPSDRWFHRVDVAIGYCLVVILLVVAALALVRFVIGVWTLMIADFSDGFNLTELPYSDFQTVFGLLITLLIVMELIHAIVNQFIVRHASATLLRSFLIITLLALTRKFLLVDIGTVSPLLLGTLALAVPALGVTLWLLGRTSAHETDERSQ